jgi:hypothetical protein
MLNCPKILVEKQTYKFNELSNDRQTVMLRTVYGMAKEELGKFFSPNISNSRYFGIIIDNTLTT